MSSDAASSLRARGTSLVGPAALARLLRESPQVVADHYLDEIAAGADMLVALTAETMPRVLGEIGMAFRAAALTRTAVDLALDAAESAPRPIAVAGLLGAAGPRSASGVFPAGTSSIPPSIPPASDRVAEEYAMHAARLAAAGCELILARGVRADLNKTLARSSRRAAVSAASATGLPTWSIIDVDASGFTPDLEPMEDAAASAIDEGARGVLFEVTSPSAAIELLERAGALDASWGFIVGDRDEGPDRWAALAKRVLDAGARALGGGHGVTSAHVAALRTVLRGGSAPSMWPRAL